VVVVDESFSSRGRDDEQNPENRLRMMEEANKVSEAALNLNE
jgi:hypothetical protein